MKESPFTDAAIWRAKPTQRPQPKLMRYHSIKIERMSEILHAENFWEIPFSPSGQHDQLKTNKTLFCTKRAKPAVKISNKRNINANFIGFHTVDKQSHQVPLRPFQSVSVEQKPLNRKEGKQNIARSVKMSLAAVFSSRNLLQHKKKPINCQETPNFMTEKRSSIGKRRKSQPMEDNCSPWEQFQEGIDSYPYFIVEQKHQEMP